MGLALAVALLCLLCGQPVLAGGPMGQAAHVLVSDADLPPADSAPWEPVHLPHRRVGTRGANAAPAVWLRAAFDLPASRTVGSHALYLPYLYAGGQIFLNGMPLATVRSSDEEVTVRWERPFMVVVPAALMRPGSNVVHVRMPAASMRFPRIVLGSLDAVRPAYERRLFWVSIVPQVTTVVCTLMSVFLLFIWWRRRQETMYGLLGMAALLWGLRTQTFVIEVLPHDLHAAWRAVYHAATGGFIVSIALFAMHFAQWRKPRLERILIAYAIAGPALMLLGPGMDPAVGRFWSAGLMPIGLMLLTVVVMAAWRQRTVPAMSLLAAISFAVIAGIHDYLLAWAEPLVVALAPGWFTHRIFLLHHAANLLLLVTVGVLVHRFVETLDTIEELNDTLELRVADRELQLERNFAALATLERERAAEEERDRIMRDMHDGLGSQLLTSLSRAERGALAQADVVDLLRGCIGEMRLALDAVAPLDDDFRSTLGNFRYRWEQQLLVHGIVSTWALAGLDDPIHVPTGQRLHVLRILQEALTNVVKHSKARHVTVSAATAAEDLVFTVQDDGQGFDARQPTTGRGVSNMRMRAEKMRAHLDLQSHPSWGTCMCLTLTRNAN